ncbi:MAG: hypothetical protein LQ340_004296 [Diploschistes diacapsis]|nr:MAG: hypothetical protein LQ340_004296 [Diploschistes diacapsis]
MEDLSTTRSNSPLKRLNNCLNPQGKRRSGLNLRIHNSRNYCFPEKLVDYARRSPALEKACTSVNTSAGQSSGSPAPSSEEAALLALRSAAAFAARDGNPGAAVGSLHDKTVVEKLGRQLEYKNQPSKGLSNLECADDVRPRLAGPVHPWLTAPQEAYRIGGSFPQSGPYVSESQSPLQGRNRSKAAKPTPPRADHPIVLDHDADTSPKESPKRDLRSSKRDSSVSSKMDLHGSSKKDPAGWITIPGLEPLREARKRKLHEDQTDNEHSLRSERPTKKARAEENRAREKIAQLKQVRGKFKVKLEQLSSQLDELKAGIKD